MKDMTTDIHVRLVELTMRPDDWTELSRTVDEATYRDIVNVYQKCEHDALPDCHSLFKVCRYLSVDCKCGSKEICEHKSKSK